MRRVYLMALSAVLIISSCEYQEIADADYPEQVIYMPAASYNNYWIDDVPEVIEDNPTPGSPARFVADTVEGTFRVLLGVYRAGIDNSGSFDVNVFVDRDTISDLVNSGSLPSETLDLPDEEISILSRVRMEDGDALAKCDLTISMDYLRSLAPDGIVALGVGISCEERKVHPELGKTVVAIDTEMMIPEADFSESDGEEPLSISFRNKSDYGMEFFWDFGDGSEISNEYEPEHQYAAAGDYEVTLTVFGVTGSADASVYKETITVEE